MQYITCRKLLHAIYEISCGRKTIEAASDYGFDTYAGFYKAFKREFSYSPKQFLKNNRLNKPYRINLFQEDHIMMTHKKLSELLTNWNLQNKTIIDIFYDCITYSPDIPAGTLSEIGLIRRGFEFAIFDTETGLFLFID